MIELQGGLMEHIKKEHRLPFIPFGDTITAFLVELGELANEIKFFKYWSKKANPTERVLEEYIDGLHFALQIFILSDVKRAYPYQSIKNESLEIQFSKLYQELSSLALCDWLDDGEVDYKVMDVIYLYHGLGEMLGFTPEEIETEYIKKNIINHNRQLTGY
jgi:dimeric dUTPase (all-alpha-NTP-PPase superfamily)